MTSLQEKFASKIAKLLAKAESTTPDEAEALIEKAQELMARYAIEEAMLDEARGKDAPEKIVERHVSFTGRYARELRELGSAIAYAQNCKVLVSTSPCGGPRGGGSLRLYVIGFEGDVERAIMLNSSLQIQAQAAKAKWERDDGGIKEWMTYKQRVLARQEFLNGFTSGVRKRLYRARKLAEDEVVSEGTDRDHLALVVRSRQDRIQDWTDVRYGKLRSSPSRCRERGSREAGAAGMAAGLSADTGHGGALRKTGELTS